VGKWEGGVGGGHEVGRGLSEGGGRGVGVVREGGWDSWLAGWSSAADGCRRVYLTFLSYLAGLGFGR